MYDIASGDVLVVAGMEYPIKAAAAWPGARFRSSRATVPASTKRANPESGMISAQVTWLTGLLVTPLMPMSGEQSTGLLEVNALDTSFIALQCFVGDETGFYHLILEDTRR